MAENDKAHEKAHDKPVDEVTGTETTGHSWDGIKELDTPLPRWWLTIFYGTIVFALVYTILYPAWPLVNSATGGVLGWNSRAEIREAMAEREAQNADIIEGIRTSAVSKVVADDSPAVTLMTDTRFSPETGQSMATASQEMIDRMARRIVDLLETPW